MSMDIFKRYMREPANSPVVNTKLLILTMGLDVNFNNLRKVYPNLKDKYKVNRIKVSDRHFISPKDEKRDYIPDELIISNESEKSLSKVYYKKDSPLSLSVKDEKFTIIEKNSRERLPVEIELVPILKYSKHKYKNVPLDEYLSVVGVDRVSIIPFDGCEYWLYGNQCKFCGANLNRLEPSKHKPNILELRKKFKGNYKKWWNFHKEEVLDQIAKSMETFLYQEEIKPHFHFLLISGNLLDLDFEYEIGLDVVDVVNKYLDLSKIDSYFNFMPPKSFDYINKVKEAGFKNLNFNLEIFNPKIFGVVCPGKQKYGYEKMLDALLYGVKVFGKGNVRTNFVLGSEPINKTIKGVYDLAKKGVVSDYSIFFPRPGSVWNKRKPPSPDEVLVFTKKLVEIYNKFGFKPFCCELSSRSSIANECYNGWI